VVTSHRVTTKRPIKKGERKRVEFLIFDRGSNIPRERREAGGTSSHQKKKSKMGDETNGCLEKMTILLSAKREKRSSPETKRIA